MFLFGNRAVLRQQNDGTGEGGGEGGGEEGSGEQTFTQADLEAHIKQRLKARDSEIAALKTELEGRPSGDEFAEVQAELAKIREANALEGKSELERVEHRHQRDIEKRDLQIAELRKMNEGFQEQLEARDKAAREGTLRAKLSSALAKAGVHGPAAEIARDAMRAALKDIEINDGEVTASYGSMIDKSPDDLAVQFLNDNEFFKSGAGRRGAGTPPVRGHDGGGKRGSHDGPTSGTQDIATGLSQRSQ